MSKSNQTEAQMIGALKQLEAGRKAEDVARECFADSFIGSIDFLISEKLMLVLS